MNLRLRFRNGMNITKVSADSVVLKSADMNDLHYKGLSSGILAVFDKLSNGGADEDALSRLVVEHDGSAKLFGYYQFIYGLTSSALIAHHLYEDSQPIAAIMPIARHYKFEQKRIDPDQVYQFSKFAYVRQEDGDFVIETPRGCAKVYLYAEPAFTLWRTLATGHSLNDLAALYDELDSKTIKQFLNLLLNAEMIVSVAEDESTIETAEGALEMWDFHDLLFHARSRQGRHNNPYGGTYRFRGRKQSPPLVKSYADHEPIALPKPDLDALKQGDAPFTAVLESRRSRRTYQDDAPLTFEQLGHFLYRAARVQQMHQPGGDMPDISFRPHPGGGAIHELNLYPIVGKCEGLAGGVYYYDPLNHTLKLVTPHNEYVQRLLHIGWMTADRRSFPQVMFGITSRFGRLQWKYESMVYAATLKNVGALYQTMYLVAEAMGLAAVGLGGGNSDLFGLTTGLDYYEESLVGEFLLGSRDPNGQEW